MIYPQKMTATKRIELWLSNHQIGEEFTAREVSKDLNMLPTQAAHDLRYRDDILKTGRGIYQKVAI